MPTGDVVIIDLDDEASNSLFSVEIPGPPVAKGRPRFAKGRGGYPHAYTPTKTREYEDYGRALIKTRYKGPLISMPIEVTVLAKLPIPKSWSKVRKERALAGDDLPTSRPDLDNFVKTALDLLTGTVIVDDALVVCTVALKIYSDSPALCISMTEI